MNSPAIGGLVLAGWVMLGREYGCRMKAGQGPTRIPALRWVFAAIPDPFQQARLRMPASVTFVSQAHGWLVCCSVQRVVRLMLPLVMSLLSHGLAWSAEQSVGVGANALPSVVRVGVAGASQSLGAVATTASYGWTEDIPPVAGSHHRLGGSVAGAVAPLPWLAVGLSLAGRWDLHPSDDRGRDMGLTGDPRILLRASSQWHRSLGVGAELIGWFPGSEAPSVVPSATTLDTRLLGSWRNHATDTVIAVLAGWRFDQSAASMTYANQLRPGDRIGLGLAESDAFLVGAGLTQSLAELEVLGELSGDWLVGRDAPAWSSSPWRATVGLRRRWSQAVSTEVLLEGCLSARRGISTLSALLPMEPKFTATAGLRYTFEAEKVGRAPAQSGGQLPARTSSQPPLTATLHGLVTDATERGLEAAQVELEVGGVAWGAATDPLGNFAWSQLPVGRANLTVRAPGFVPVQRDVTLAGEVALTVVLERALPAGQLRGLVRAYSGEPLPARVRVLTTEATVETDPNGRFEVNLAPGTHPIQIEADGYQGQQRVVRIEERGVTVVNVELEARP
ncbi:carboxypeptidase-like regulatory domain-containing protein [Myxococcota bacterium]